MSEFHEQCALFEWARNPAVQRKYPGIDLLEASLNGVHLHKAQAGKAKAAGLLAGALDLNLPVARGPYHGLRIEMKYGKNKMSDEQVWYATRLVEEGWRVATCWNWEAAKHVIVEYLTTEDMFAPAGAAMQCAKCGFSTLLPAPWQGEFFDAGAGHA